MTEEVTTQAVVKQEPETSAQATPVADVGKDGKPFDAVRAQALIEKLQKENELTAKEKERADAELTESERQKKRADEAEAEAAKLKAEALRKDAVLEAGLPKEWYDRLKGATYDELLADAQSIAKTLPTLKQAPHVNATNPSNPDANESDAQKRARLFGTPANIFDPENIKAKGGGVVWNK
jgi:hypothetical protein